MLAEAIIKIGNGFEVLLEQTQLTKRAIITLVLDLPEVRGGKIGRQDVELILNNLPKLKSYYIRK